MTITASIRALVLIAGLTVLLTACNFNVEQPTPTVEGIEEPINPIPDSDASPSPTGTFTPSPTPSAEVLALETAPPTSSATAEAATITPTPTEGPYEHRVEQGEVLVNIIQKYGYFDFGVFSAIRELNPDVDINNLQAGRVIRIPRPSATPTPQGFELTAVVNATLGITPLQAIPDNAPIDCHTVNEGDTIISIAQDYNTTIEIIKQLNHEIYFPPTCDFNSRSGGPECNISIQIGQCVRVAFPTPTITQTPTPSGSETPTPTPPYPSPRVISPPNGAIISGIVPLEWVSAGLLQPDEAYFIQIYSITNPDTAPITGVSRSNTYMLPSSLVPRDGQDHQYEWTVAVARLNAQRTAYALVGNSSPRQAFTLRSPQ